MMDGFSDGLPDNLIVSRETVERLERHESLLRKWNPRINLVAQSTIEHLRTRHFLDSAQLLQYAPDRGVWLDLGSGAGFPGVVVAILAQELHPKISVSLVESDQRKATFLRTVARETKVEMDVYSDRIEKLASLDADILSARALAPLTTLLGFAERHLRPDGVAIFPKGEKADQEIEEAVEQWRFDCEKNPSVNEAKASVLVVRNIQRV